MNVRGPVLDVPRPEAFDVVCAGKALFRRTSGSGVFATPAASAGLLDVTKAIARSGARVGLATVLDDDRVGRTTLAEIASLGVDVAGVKLASTGGDFVVVDAAGGESRVLSEHGAVPELTVPAHWSAQVVLVSGVSAVTSRLAASCRAARRARREGATVVVDVMGSLRHWAGRDARVISMLLREADVVRCSAMELAVIGLDASSARAAMRATATLVMSDERAITATGPFGETNVPAPSDAATHERLVQGCTAAICVELARASAEGAAARRRVAESPSGWWHRVVRHEALRFSSPPRARQRA